MTMTHVDGGPRSRNDNLLYPDSPGFKVSGASQAAAVVRPIAAALRAKVLECLRTAPATADEVAGRLDHSPLGIRPRVAELKRLGLIRATGERRRNRSGMSATVWAVRVAEGGAE